MRSDPPRELGLMGLDAAHFVPADDRSWRGPCPRCGGSRRFLVFTDRPWPSWNTQCDLCGLTAWADQLNGALRQPVPDELRREWAQERERERRIRDEERRRRLDEFTAAELWDAYHRKLGETQRRWWDAAGIPADWQEFYRVGYVPERTFSHAGQPFVSSAYTIPIFEAGHDSMQGWQPVNMQYRLTTPPDGAGKYRQEPGLPAAAFVARPDWDWTGFDGRVLVVEGAKKAAVAHIHITSELQAIGVPGARSWAGVPDLVREAERVYVCLDPDAQQAALDLTREIGPNARRVVLPGKPDDLVLQHGMTARDFARYLKQADRP